MASESSEEQTVSVALSPELVEWLDEHAASQELDRETLLAQLVASYRTTATQEGDLDTDALVSEKQLETVIESRLAAWLEPQVQTLVADAFEEIAAEHLDSESVAPEELNEATNAVQRQLSNRIDSVDAEFQSKIEDVRERVIQVKKEADTKAPRDHSHDEFDEFDSLADQVATLQADLTELRNSYDETVPGTADSVTQHTEQLEEMQDRLQTIAWVVSDLREAQEKGGGLEAVERIKIAAARADIERANCENCGNGVTISLLTDPTCPHCNTTVTNVEPASGWFSDPKLLVASQLESGEQYE